VYSTRILFDRLEELTQSKQEGTLTETEWRERQNELLDDVKAAYTQVASAKETVKNLADQLTNREGEVEQLKQERDDAIHARTALEEDLQKALLPTAETVEVAKSHRINAKVIRTLCEMLDVSPATIPLRVRRLIVAEKRLDQFRGPDGKLPYPTTKAEREKIRQRPFKKRKVEA
jgi:chromosome segregation ATPase